MDLYSLFKPRNLEFLYASVTASSSCLVYGLLMEHTQGKQNIQVNWFRLRQVLRSRVCLY